MKAIIGVSEEIYSNSFSENLQKLWLKQTNSREAPSWLSLFFFRDCVREIFSLRERKKGSHYKGAGSNALYKNRKKNKWLRCTAKDWRPCDLPKAAGKPLIWLKGYITFMHGCNNK